MIERALANPETRQQGIALAAATATGGIAGRSKAMAQDAKAPEEVRVAAVEAIGSFRITPNRVLEQLVSSVRGKPSSNSVAEAAVRAMAQHSVRGDELTDLLTARDYPLGLRREALRSVSQLRDGGSHVIELARQGKLPEDLKNEATTLLYTSPDRRLREQASSVLPLPKTAAGRPLPPICRADSPRGRCRQRACGLLSRRRQLVRELPPRAGEWAVGRAGPVDDRRQVRQG